jgi:3D (Asp-Asp-Asp) domain-containing protein
MKSTAIGSAVSVLLVFSAISYANGYIPHQDPKPVQQPAPAQQVQISNQQPGTLPANPGAESAKQESKVSGPTVAESAGSPSAVTGPVIEKAAASVNDGDFEVAPETYTATAYSLRGRTASGRPVSRGLIAADLSVLPLGTRVRVEAGSFSGEYVVADTGGAVKGHSIDIWTPTSREALQFGRQAVKLTVLSFGGRRPKTTAVRPRRVNAVPLTPPATQPIEKQEK